MKLETVPLGSISFDPANTRKHSRRNLDAIKASLRRFGQQKPIVVDAKGVVLAGNGTLAAATELGWSEIQIVRTALAGVDATAFGIADNRTAELAEWDDKLGDVLAALKAEDFPLAEIGFDEADLAELAGEPEPSDADAEPQIDKAEELRAKWGVELGQIWELGQHRIACGDSTLSEHVNKLLNGQKANLVLTDPPYGIGYQYADHIDDKKLNADLVTKVFALHDCGKVWTSGLMNLSRDIERFGKTKIAVWHKKFAAAGNGVGGASTWEPILILNPAIKNLANDVIVLSTEKIAVNGVNLRELHTCPKPVQLYRILAEAFTRPRDIVFEPFSGSGTTLIACEQCGRVCYASEISPAYVAVAIQRWADATGKEPRKL